MPEVVKVHAPDGNSRKRMSEWIENNFFTSEEEFEASKFNAP